MNLMVYSKALVLGLFLVMALFVVSSAWAQGLNVASVYPISGEVSSGDIVINSGAEGLTTSDVQYDARIFGVVDDAPLIVMREATPEANIRPVVTSSNTIVNVIDANGEVKKGDFITTSAARGKGMKAGQSGYVVGIALEDGVYADTTVQVDGGSARLGTVVVLVRVEYAELTTAKSTNRLLEQLNKAFFSNIQEPERFNLLIRYVIAGIIAISAFGIGFFAVTRSVRSAIEALGRNPLARGTIIFSLGIQLGVTIVGALAAVAAIFLILRI